MCVAYILNYLVAHRYARHRNRFIAVEFFEDPELMIATTAALSHLDSTVFPLHELPTL